MAGHWCNFWWLAPDDYGKAGHKRPEAASNLTGCTQSCCFFIKKQGKTSDGRRQVQLKHQMLVQCLKRFVKYVVFEHEIMRPAL
jgi:hypothetical protein